MAVAPIFALKEIVYLVETAALGELEAYRIGAIEQKTTGKWPSGFNFKRIIAGLRMIFGGEVRAYSSLLDRARREALLRMKMAYPEADAYVNCRIQTASISKGQRDSVGSIEVLAYGTAIKLQQ